MGRVVVVGSLNVDHTVKVERFPEVGDTVTASGFAGGLGGKGFNQAVTAARMGVARAAGVVTILNSASARTLTNEFLTLVDYLVANETEADHLGRVSYRGVAVITGGERGVLVLVPGRESRRIPALPVPVVDTTAAGDAFCGCFAAALASGGRLAEALQRATAAGANAVTIEGAFASLPSAVDVDRLLHQSRSEAHS